jgi:hypothetical protein
MTFGELCDRTAARALGARAAFHLRGERPGACSHADGPWRDLVYELPVVP